MKKLLVGLLILACLPQPARSITLVGLDNDGRTQIQSLSRAEWTEKMSSLLSTVVSSTLPALESSTARSSHFQEDSQWTLMAVILGLELNLNFGVTPVLFFSVSPSVSFFFSDPDHIDPPHG